jgi:hypothetical protein
MRVIDARWFADRATAASWTHALLVQPGLEDVAAAAADRDWETCLLAALLTAEKLVFCDLVLDGSARTPREPDILLAVDGPESPATAALTAIHAIRADHGAAAHEAGADAARAMLAAADEYVRSRVPIDVLPMRTPEGFYPSVRIAAELDRLRTSLGLGPFEWEWWANLS